MAIILSISKTDERIWAAGPNGLFRLEQDRLVAVPQPMQRLACVLALPERLLVGGEPHVVAYSTGDAQNWQAAWTNNSAAAVLTVAADPDVTESGVLLAGSEGEGILRSTDRGRTWSHVNFGLRNYVVLALAWAPPAPGSVWPQREIVFAGTEEGIYRSPNGGRGWKRSESDEAVFQSIAVSPRFHTDGVVLAGSEGSGLWRSTDGGRSFERVASAPQQVNALVAWDDGWLLSDVEQLWRSADGVAWQPIPESEPALVFYRQNELLLAGGENGLVQLDPRTGLAITRFASPIAEWIEP